MGIYENYSDRKRREANEKARDFLKNNNGGGDGCGKSVILLLGLVLFGLIIAIPPLGLSILAIVLIYLFFFKR